MKATWKPHEEQGKLTSEERKELPEAVYAFPKQRKEPMTDDAHVRNAIVRFDQVKNVTDADREQAFANLQAAARHYGVDMAETDWHELGLKPHTPNTEHQR